MVDRPVRGYEERPDAGLRGNRLPPVCTGPLPVATCSNNPSRLASRVPRKMPHSDGRGPTGHRESGRHQKAFDASGACDATTLPDLGVEKQLTSGRSPMRQVHRHDWTPLACPTTRSRKPAPLNVCAVTEAAWSSDSLISGRPRPAGQRRVTTGSSSTERCQCFFADNGMSTETVVVPSSCSMDRSPIDLAIANPRPRTSVGFDALRFGSKSSP